MKKIGLTVVYICLLVMIVWLANRGELAVGKWLHHIPLGDKLGHFLLVGGCAFIVNWCLGCAKLQFSHYSVLWGSLAVFLVFTLEEFSQIFLSNRAFDLTDLFFNTLGIIVFGYLVDWLHARTTANAVDSHEAD